MPENLSHWIGPFVPVILMLAIVVMNHRIAGQRNDRKTAAEASRLCAALAAELRGMLELYQMNLDLIDRRANYLLSTRSSIVVYKGNVGRLTALLQDAQTIHHVVSVFARNERIEGVIAAAANLKCNMSYQFPPAEAKFDEWRVLYEQGLEELAATCRLLEAHDQPREAANAAGLRAMFDQLALGIGDPDQARTPARKLIASRLN